MLSSSGIERRLTAVPQLPLRVLVLAARPDGGERLADRLRELGHEPIGPFSDERTAATAFAPDLCLIELELPGGRALLLTPELADRRESRPLVLRLAEPATTAQLGDAIELAAERALALRLIKAQAGSARGVMRDVDAVERAKAVLRAGLGMSERHASRRLRAAAHAREERLADAARRVWQLRTSYAGDDARGIAA